MINEFGMKEADDFKHICSILVGYKHFLTFFTFELDLRKLTLVGSLICCLSMCKCCTLYSH